MGEPQFVYLLWHGDDLDDDLEPLLLGVYSSQEAALDRIERSRAVSGFAEHPDDFHVVRKTIDADEWTDGFVALVVVLVELLDEVVEVWRPVDAQVLPDGTYRLSPVGRDDEVWAFPPGSTVRCVTRGTDLVAVEAVRPEN